MGWHCVTLRITLLESRSDCIFFSQCNFIYFYNTNIAIEFLLTAIHSMKINFSTESWVLSRGFYPKSNLANKTYTCDGWNFKIYPLNLTYFVISSLQWNIIFLIMMQSPNILEFWRWILLNPVYFLEVISFWWDCSGQTDHRTSSGTWFHPTPVQGTLVGLALSKTLKLS